MDNLPVHRTSDVEEKCKELDITRIFNKSYSPDFNPIESVFSIVKNAYKRARLSNECRELDYDMGELINDAFERVTETKVRNCVNKSMRLLRVHRVGAVFPKIQT